jgi:hypothetical protein
MYDQGQLGRLMHAKSRKKQLRIKCTQCAGIEKRRRDREKKWKRRRGEGE